MTRPTLRGLLLPVPADEDAISPVPARDVLALLSSLRPGRSWLTRVENLYIAVFTVAVLVGVFWTVLKRAGTVFVDVASFYEFVWGPPLIVLIFLGVLRYSTVQGFVSFSEPDCFYILPAPLRRADLVRPRLLAATILLGAGGAIGGILALVASSGSHSGARIGEAALAGLALGVMLVAASWHVQRSRAATALVIRLTLPLVGLIILLAFAQTGGHTTRFIGLWSGPWGWGILPLASGAPSYGIAALGALCVLALVAGISVFRTAGEFSLEGFRVRARTRSQVVASLYAFDYRSVGQAARGEKTQTWQGRIRPRAPRRPVLTVPWHGSLTLLRSPVRLGWGIVLAGAGMYLLALQPTQQGALWAGGVALYLAASSLLEPLRQEVDTPGAAKVLLPWRFEKVLWLHCLLPVGIMVAAGLLTLLGGLAVGALTVARHRHAGDPHHPADVRGRPLRRALRPRGGPGLDQLGGTRRHGHHGLLLDLRDLPVDPVGRRVARRHRVGGLAVGALDRGSPGFQHRLDVLGGHRVFIVGAAAMQWGVSTKQRPGLMERFAEMQQGNSGTSGAPAEGYA